jgi:predicted dehydrogenase
MINENLTRRDFIRRSSRTAGGLAAAGAVIQSFIPGSVLGANDRINIAVIGIHGRGREHYREWARNPGVRVKTICDPDENLFKACSDELEKLQGSRPKTEFDLRRVFDDKDIDAVSIATPDHWHALTAIWACQAGKHVYAEKPISHNIWEGRKVVEAARKYNRIVATGMQNRSINGVREAMKFLHEGKLGDIYMARALCFKPRDSIGKQPDAPVPPGVHYDLWLGPAPARPFNPNRFHYNWHWFWDYGCSDMGNQGPHQMDIARWGLNKAVHPKKIKCVGGYFAFDSDQESPNTQIATFEYDDGKIVQFEVRGVYTNSEEGILIGNLFYGALGWMQLNGNEWKTFFGRKNQPGPSYTNADEKAADPSVLTGSGSSPHFRNFIDTLRSGNRMNLPADIEEGHMSTSMCHLGNISNRLGRELTFDSHAERFIGDDIADSYLTRNYRNPYVVPEKV